MKNYKSVCCCVSLYKRESDREREEVSAHQDSQMSRRNTNMRKTKSIDGETHLEKLTGMLHSLKLSLSRFYL